jgi:hypothetical protein
LRSEVQSLLERNPNLDLETAYWAAKGKQGKGSTAGIDKARREATRQAAQIATAPARKGVVPSRPTERQARSMSNEDILAAAQALAPGRVAHMGACRPLELCRRRPLAVDWTCALATPERSLRPLGPGTGTPQT